jgi:uncharacterized protein (DUF1330 family)
MKRRPFLKALLAGLLALSCISTQAAPMTDDANLTNQPSCYFIVDVYIDEARGRGLYDRYIEKVKPIVESCGGQYLARSEKVTSLSPDRKPQRVIIIRFPSKDALETCLASKAYQDIMGDRTTSVDARALIVE